MKEYYIVRLYDEVAINLEEDEDEDGKHLFLVDELDEYNFGGAEMIEELFRGDDQADAEDVMFGAELKPMRIRNIYHYENGDEETDEEYTTGKALALFRVSVDENGKETEKMISTRIPELKRSWYE